MEPYYNPKDNHGHLYGRVARPSDKVEKIEEWGNEPACEGFPWTGENIKAIARGYWNEYGWLFSILAGTLFGMSLALLIN